MTSEEMYYNAYVELNSFDQDNFPGEITTDDVTYYLNKAQNQWVKEHFDPTDPRRNGFEQSQRVADELKTLYVMNEELDAYYGGDNSGVAGYVSDVVDLPDDHMFTVSHRPEITRVLDPAHITVNTSGTDPVREVVSGEESRTSLEFSKVVQSDDIYQILYDPFNTTEPTGPIVTIGDNKIAIYTTDTFFVERVFLNYIKQPLEIIFEGSGASNNQDCELPEFTHNEIVDLAVKLFLQSRGKFQSNNQN